MMSFQILEDGVTKRLNDMIERCKPATFRAYLNRVVYGQYQEAQINRWKTENESETGQWQALNPAYKQYKRSRFAAYPYGGDKMGVATGNLLKKAVKAQKITTEYGIELKVTVPYAVYYDEVRTISKWGPNTRRTILKGMKEFIFRRKE